MSNPPSDTAVTCDNCPAVCCRLPVLLIGDNAVPEAMTDWTDWGGQVMRRDDDGWCVAVDRTRMCCSIHPDRPQICRDFEMGGEDCLAERAVYFT